MRRSTSDKPFLTVPAVAGIKTSERSRSMPLSFNSPLANSPVSSPGSGGGPADRSVGTAPDTPVISTPPDRLSGRRIPLSVSVVVTVKRKAIYILFLLKRVANCLRVMLCLKNN